jgi:ATP synthase protein I
MSDPDDGTVASRLKELEDRIAKAKGAAPVKDHSEEHYSQGQLAWRMVIELVAGLGIGFGIGYGLDSFLGTMPIFLVLFIFLGLAAGIKTMLRSAQEVQRKQMAHESGRIAASKEEGERRGR